LALTVIGILAGIATAGGFWKLSDIITARVNKKVDEEKEALQRLSDKLFDDLAGLKVNVAQKEKELEALSHQMRVELEAFSREADEHRRKVETVSEQIVTEMQSRVLEVSAIVDASGRQSTVITQAEPTPATGSTDVGLPVGITRVFAASPGQYATESLIRGKYFGSFAYYFIKALLDPAADKDGDGAVSLREAVLAAKKSLKTRGFSQDPFVKGPAASISLFALRKVSVEERPSGKLLVLLIGINEYSGEVPSLQGAVNDVSHFRKLIENKNRLLAEEAECHTLTDKEATRSRIEEETQWLRASATSKDIVLFFFSGHGTSILDAKNKKQKEEILLPHDAGSNLENAFYVAKLMDELSGIRSRATIFMTG
jgi:hypothetical protein